MKTVLLSSTRQWNVGDDFIRLGCQRLIEHALGERCNWMLFDRNPDILGRHKIAGNSWRGDSLSGVDLAVFAGTPEWFGAPVQQLCGALSATKIPILYLGVGGASAAPQHMSFTPEDRACLKLAGLAIARDATAAMRIAETGQKVHTLPCPAFFASACGTPRKPAGKLRLALTVQESRTVNQAADAGLCSWIFGLARELSGRYDVRLICHYKDELYRALATGLEVRYSYDEREALSFYEDVDAVVSLRVHGAIAGASCGAPSFLVGESLRAKGVAALFPGMHQTQQSTLKALEGLDVGATSSQILERKRQAFKTYTDLIRKALT